MSSGQEYLADASLMPGIEGRNSRLTAFCLRTLRGQYWQPDETDTLDQIENDLLEFVFQYGLGWAVYTRRLASADLREYFFYFVGDAELDKVAPALKAKYPEYRIESEAKPDLSGDL